MIRYLRTMSHSSLHATAGLVNVGVAARDYLTASVKVSTSARTWCVRVRVCAGAVLRLLR